MGDHKINDFSTEEPTFLAWGFGHLVFYLRYEAVLTL